MARTRKTPDPEVETPAEEVESPADKVIDTVTHTQQEALQAMEVAGTTLLTGLNEMQREIADFVAKRIREDMETQQDLLRCRNLDDVRAVQTRFFRNAMEQYSAETTRLMKLGSDLMARATERDGL
jgi:hypothetical protein